MTDAVASDRERRLRYAGECDRACLVGIIDGYMNAIFDTFRSSSTAGHGAPRLPACCRIW